MTTVLSFLFIVSFLQDSITSLSRNTLSMGLSHRMQTILFLHRVIGFFSGKVFDALESFSPLWMSRIQISFSSSFDPYECPSDIVKVHGHCKKNIRAAKKKISFFYFQLISFPLSFRLGRFPRLPGVSSPSLLATRLRRGTKERDSSSSCFSTFELLFQKYTRRFC